LREWQVTLRTPDGDVTLGFVESTGLADPLLRPTVIDQLLELAKENAHYYVSVSLQEVLSPEGEDMSDRQLFVILARSRRHGFVVGYLLGELDLGEESALAVLGLWPPEFYELAARDGEAHLRLLLSILTEPEEWETVDLAIPAEEGGSEALDEKA